MPSITVFANGTIIDGTGAAARAGCRARRRRPDRGASAKRPRGGARRRVCTESTPRGMTVMPGLIDAHCPPRPSTMRSPTTRCSFTAVNALSALVAAYNARKVLRAGVTSMLDPDSVFECTIDVRDAIEAGRRAKGRASRAGAYALMTSVGGTAGRLIPDHGVHRLGQGAQGQGRDRRGGAAPDQDRRRLDQGPRHRPYPAPEAQGRAVRSGCSTS